MEPVKCRNIRPIVFPGFLWSIWHRTTPTSRPSSSTRHGWRFCHLIQKSSQHFWQIWSQFRSSFVLTGQEELLNKKSTILTALPIRRRIRKPSKRIWKFDTNLLAKRYENRCEKPKKTCLSSWHSSAIVEQKLPVNFFESAWLVRTIFHFNSMPYPMAFWVVIRSF